MITYKISVGSLRTNCYLATDEATKETVIIDPGDEPEKIIELVNKNSLIPKFIILTHSHPDHIGAVESVKKHFGIEVAMVKEGDKIKIGDSGLEIIKTAGHTVDSICIVAPSVIFTGDTLFKNSIGRTDLAGGDNEKIKESLARLAGYPDDFKIYPGHGLESIIGKEKKNNPFLADL